jgi:CheY-like chemotaxis protein
MRSMQRMQLDTDDLSALGLPRPVLTARRRGNSPVTTRVLIADDYADAAKSLALVLSIAGVATTIAMDGEEALALAEAWHPHICVLDILMPKLDGLDVARRIREGGWIARPLLIAMTGRTTAQDKRSALEAGFDHYMTKPADPAMIVRLIQSYTSGNDVSRPACDTSYRP